MEVEGSDLSGVATDSQSKAALLERRAGERRRAVKTRAGVMKPSERNVFMLSEGLALLGASAKPPLRDTNLLSVLLVLLFTLDLLWSSINVILANV